MQRTHTALHIDGHLVHTGAAVQVKWLGVWYEGTVIKIGPKRNLCKVRDVKTRETVLLETKHLQFKETRMMDKRVTAGAQVVYKDGDYLLEGVVESRSAVGVIMASWRKSGLSKENLTWFELSHVAPIIHNHLYEEHNRDMLEAGKSGLLHNDAIEPRPRTMDNLLYDSGSDEEADIVTEKAASKSHRNSGNSPRENRDFKEDEHKLAEPAHLPLPPGPLTSYPIPPTPIFLPLPPTMPHPYGNMFLPLDQNHYMKLSSSFTSAPSQPSALPHPPSLKRPGLAQTSVPCIMSYSRSTNGIPPHPSSRFFQSLRNVGLGKRKLLRRQVKQRVKKSPTLLSKANSDPTQYATIEELAESSAKVEEPDIEEDPDEALFQAQTHTPQTTLSPNAALHSLSPQYHPQTKRTKNSPTQHALGKKDQPQTVPPPLPPRPTKPLPHLRSPTTRQEPQHAPNSASEFGVVRGRVRSHVRAEERGIPVAEQEVVSNGVLEVHTDHEESLDDNEKRKALGLGVVSASPAHVTVPHGGSTLLSCVFRSPRPLHYQWFKDGKPISDNDPFFTQPAPGMLQIQMASLYLTGEYTCVARDSQNSFDRVFHLEVYSDTLAVEDDLEPDPQSEVVPRPEEEADVGNVAQVDSSKQQKPPIVIVEGPQHDSQDPKLVYTPPQQQATPTVDIPGTRGDAAVMKEHEDDIATEQEVAEGSNRAKRNRRRVSSTLKNDMEQYLEGYGENYGALSSQTNELEPWKEELEEEEGEKQRKRKPKGKKRKRKKDKISSQRSSSPSKSGASLWNTDSPKRSRKNTELSKLPSGLLGKGRKKTEVDTSENLHPEPVALAWQEETTTNLRTEAPPAQHDKEETNSIAVHTSVGGSSGSEVSLGGPDRGRLELPREQESLNDSVRRLQLSVQEHCPEQLQLSTKERKKGFLSNVFPRK